LLLSGRRKGVELRFVLLGRICFNRSILINSSRGPRPRGDNTVIELIGGGGDTLGAS
jgi:hypothetical protein